MEQQTGRQGLTYEDIASVADSITARGERPTLRAVRAEVGSGSMGTIQKHLSAWQASRRQAVTSSISLPTEIQRVILAEIERSVSEARAALEAELAGVKSDRDLLTEDNEQQAAKMEQQAAELARSDAINQQQAGRIAQLETDLASLTASNEREREAAEKARLALAKAELRLEALPRIETDLASMTTACEHERSSAEQARLALAKAELRLEALPRIEAELDRLRTALDTERQGRHQAEQRGAVLAAQLAGTETRLVEVQGREQKAVAVIEDQHARLAVLAEKLRTATEARLDEPQPSA